MRIQSLLNTPELLSANNSSVCRRSEKGYGYGLSNYEASLYSPRKLVSPTGWSKCEPRVAWTILRWFIDKTFWNHSPVRGSVVSVDLELLHSIHAFQGAESLQINPLIYKCCRLKMFSCPHCVILLTCSGTLLDPVTNCRNLALSVWSKLLSARQNLNTNVASYDGSVGGAFAGTHQTIWRLVALYLWYSVLAFRSSMLMSGRPDSSSSSSCSLKMAISLQSWHCTYKQFYPDCPYHLTFGEWCRRIPPGKPRAASWWLPSSSSDTRAWCSPSCCRQLPGSSEV